MYVILVITSYHHHPYIIIIIITITITVTLNSEHLQYASLCAQEFSLSYFTSSKQQYEIVSVSCNIIDEEMEN